MSEQTIDKLLEPYFKDMEKYKGYPKIEDNKVILMTFNGKEKIKGLLNDTWVSVESDRSFLLTGSEYNKIENLLKQLN